MHRPYSNEIIADYQNERISDYRALAQLLIKKSTRSNFGAIAHLQDDITSRLYRKGKPLISKGQVREMARTLLRFCSHYADHLSESPTDVVTFVENYFAQWDQR